MREGSDVPGSWEDSGSAQQDFVSSTGSALSTKQTLVSPPDNVFLGSHLSPRMQSPHERPARYVSKVHLTAGPALSWPDGLL